MATRRWRLKEVMRGPVDFGYDGDSSSRDVTFYGSTSGAKMVWDTSEDELTITAPSGEDGIDIDGAANIGYVQSATLTGYTTTPDTGSIRVVEGTANNLWLAGYTTLGWRYVGLTTTTTAD